MTIIAHISDTHFDGSERALTRSRRAMAYLRGCAVDAILVTGDLTDHGDVKEYEQVKPSRPAGQITAIRADLLDKPVCRAG